jgi:predicted RNA-binding Zn-ribbon protein involved in translation (DUF1610 family)
VTQTDPPPKQYSPEDVRRLQAEFAPIAASYRRHGLIGICGILVFAAAIITNRFLPKPFRADEVIEPMLILAFIIAAAFCLAPTLTCPGCSNNLRDQPADYCPECGAHAILRGDDYYSARCTACGKTMDPRPRGCAYKVRYCTYCGLKVDDKGL